MYEAGHRYHLSGSPEGRGPVGDIEAIRIDQKMDSQNRRCSLGLSGRDASGKSNAP
jgi:hypothetical protein